MCLANRKKVQMSGGWTWQRTREREREGEETFAHCGQKLENANKCKLAIFISLSPRVCFFLLLASSFFLALLLHCHVTNSSREVCSFHPLSLSSVSLPPCLPLLPGDSYSKVFWSLAFKVSHLYGIFMRSYECD